MSPHTFLPFSTKHIHRQPTQTDTHTHTHTHTHTYIISSYFFSINQQYLLFPLHCYIHTLCATACAKRSDGFCPLTTPPKALRPTTMSLRLLLQYTIYMTFIISRDDDASEQNKNEKHSFFVCVCLSLSLFLFLFFLSSSTYVFQKYTRRKR